MILFSPANATTKSPGLDGMEVAAPQANASFGNLFNNTSTISNTTNGKRFIFLWCFEHFSFV